MINKFSVKKSSELASQSRDLAEISQWKVVQETDNGYIIVAHIPDYLVSPQDFATTICEELNDKRTFPTGFNTLTKLSF